jgi:hypothetical protein
VAMKVGTLVMPSQKPVPVIKMNRFSDSEHNVDPF